MIYAPSATETMDIQAHESITSDELRTVVSGWMEERTNRRFHASEDTILLRKVNGSCLHGPDTLKELGVQSNECFYLF